MSAKKKPEKLADPDDGITPINDRDSLPIEEEIERQVPTPPPPPGPLPKGSPAWMVKEHERKHRHGQP